MLPTRVARCSAIVISYNVSWLARPDDVSARAEYMTPSRHVLARPSHAVIPSDATPSGVGIYRDDSVPGGLRTDHDDPPAYDDPSKFSGG
jgi:hypothetical protein